MRISDWSSCVCSSDLPPIPGASPVTDSLCISPVDNREYARRPVASDDRIEAAFVRARQAQRDWARLSIAERAGCCTALVDAMLALREEIVPELAWQMGRPVKFGVGERSEEHTSELQSLMRISYAVFCLKKTKIE